MNMNTETMNETEPKVRNTECLLDCTSDELLIALLIAELGTERYEALVSKLLGRVPAEVGIEITDFSSAPLQALSEQLDSVDRDHQVRGGLGEAFIEAISQHDLSSIANAGRDAAVLSEAEVFLMGILSQAKVGQLDSAMLFLDTKVSMAAGRSARELLKSMLDDLRVNSGPMGVITEDEMAQVIVDRLPADLRGPKKAPRQGSGLLASLLSVLASGPGRRPSNPLDELMGLGQPRVPAGMPPELVELLGLGGRPSRGGPRASILSLDDLLGGRLPEGVGGASKAQVTVGDSWRMLNIPFGLPNTVEDLLRLNRPASDKINMDQVRATPIGLFNDENFGGMTEAFDAMAGDDLGDLPKRVFLAIHQHMLDTFGSIDEAEMKTIEWMVEQGEIKAASVGGGNDGQFQIPTPNCDCAACNLTKRLARKGIRFDMKTGAMVKAEPTEL